MIGTVLYVYLSEYQDTNGEWKESGKNVFRTRKGVDRMLELEGRDLSCGGLIAVSKAPRRVRLLEVAVTSEEVIRV